MFKKIMSKETRLTIFIGIVMLFVGLNLSGQTLSDSTWWMFHHDYYHTGFSPLIGDMDTCWLGWSYNTGDYVSSSPAIADIDGDGKPEVVVGSRDDKIYALNGEDGSFLWSYNTGGHVYSSPAIADIDGNGDLDVVVGSNNNNIYALNGKIDTLLWSYHANGDIWSSPAIADIDGDGKLEVVVGATDYKIYALNGEDGSLLWSYRTGDWVTSSPAIADIDGDGKPEVVVGSEDSTIYALNGEDSTLLWSRKTGGAIESSPVIADIDGDGKPEVVVGSYDYKIYALNGEDGSVLWLYNTSDVIYSSPAIADIDGDGKPEVVVGSEDDKIYALNGEDGSVLWSYNTDYMVESSPAIADIDGDGKPEVVVGSDDYKIYALNGEDGSVLWSYRTGDWVESSPAIADIDGDGKVEVVVGSDNSKIYVINGVSIKISSPNGGEQVAGGSMQPITWAGSGYATCNIFFSKDGGTSYPDTVALDVPSDSTYWNSTLPAINNSNCRIKIQVFDTSHSFITEDESDSNFSIQTYPTVTSPNGGEIWAGGSTQPITWTTVGSGFGSYRLLYSTDGGVSYSDTIASGISPDSTSWDWTLPPVNSTTCRVKVQILDSLDNIISEDASDSNFEMWNGYYLAGSQYPMFHYNLAHTGKSPYYGDLSGNIKWYFATGNAVSSSPVIGSDGMIYFTSEDDTLYALGIDGTKKWSKYLEKATKTLPAIANDSTIYIGDGNGILHAYWKNGTTKWEYSVSDSIVSSPVIGSDGVIYFGSTNDTLYAINSDGTLKWKFATGGSILSSPAISSDGTIYVGSNDNKLYAVNPDGTEAWNLGTPDLIISSPAIDTASAEIYVGSYNGKLYAINQNGSIANTFTTGGVITSSPAIGDSMIFFGSYDGKIYALDKNLNLKWSYQTGDKIESSPVIDANGHIYIGSDNGTFYCFRGSDSTVIWNFNTGNAVKSSPAIAGNSCIYVGSDNGRLYAFGPNAPAQVISPNGGEDFQKNTVQNIYWSTTGTVTNIKLRYSLDSGTSWNVISDSEEDDGIYSWTLPDTISSQCRVKVIAFDGAGDSAIDVSDGDFSISLTGIKENTGLIPMPKVFFIAQNCPNPFTGVTEIRYGVPKDANVNVSIYNLLGQRITTLVNENKKAGYYTTIWDARAIRSGVYFIRLTADSFVQTKKAILTR